MKAEFDTLIDSATPVIVDFFAEWCGPCKAQAPILQELARDLGEKVKVIKVDVDKNRELAMRYKIQSVPTIMVFKNREAKFRQSGMMNKTQLLDIVMKNA